MEMVERVVIQSQAQICVFLSYVEENLNSIFDHMKRNKLYNLMTMNWDEMWVWVQFYTIDQLVSYYSLKYMCLGHV